MNTSVRCLLKKYDYKVSNFGKELQIRVRCGVRVRITVNLNLIIEILYPLIIVRLLDWIECNWMNGSESVSTIRQLWSNSIVGVRLKEVQWLHFSGIKGEKKHFKISKKKWQWPFDSDPFSSLNLAGRRRRRRRRGRRRRRRRGGRRSRKYKLHM